MAGPGLCLDLLLPALVVFAGASLLPCAKAQPPPTLQVTPPDFKTLRRQGYDLFQQGQFLDAAGLNQRGFDLASAHHDRAAAIRFLGNLGACQLATFDYRAAMDTFTRVREMAQASGDTEMIATSTANIATIYVAMGQLRQAVSIAEQAFQIRRASPHAHWDQMLLHIAWIYARGGELERAIPIFLEGIAAADRRGDSYYQAKGWDRLGYEFLQRGELETADHCLTEAFRIRTLTRSRELYLSYPKLGMLRLAQGDLHSASVLMDLAVSSGRNAPGLTVLSQVYHDRGVVRSAQGRHQEAFDDFRTAVEYARRWRAGVLPVDSMQASTEVSLSRIYASFLRAGNRQYLKTRQPRLVRATLDAAEENRLASLRSMLHTPETWQRRLPPAYWQSLARLHAAEASLLREENPALRRRIDQLRLALTALETQAGLESEWRSGLSATERTPSIDAAQRNLASNETLFSFHLDEPESWVWAMTSNALELYRLPPRKQIAEDVRRFRNAVRDGGAEARSLGENLYHQLFGEIARRFSTKHAWTIVLDDALFELPLAALVVSRDGRPAYLVERHALQVTPSAMLVSSGESVAAGPFVGIGDPVYNRADPRWQGAREPRRAPWSFLQPAARTEGPLELARLAGSGREVEGCAAVMRQRQVDTLLLRGADASRERIAQALASEPAVIHFATHVLRSAHRADQALIALSLRPPRAEGDFLSAVEIAAERRRLGLVVLSGCSSGAGEALPGVGLMGLARAWMLAGARAVVASHWPTPDDSGELFLSFYGRWTRAGGVLRRPSAALLQAAQLEMLRAKGWRSQPSYWAAYFIVGRGRG